MALNNQQKKIMLMDFDNTRRSEVVSFIQKFMLESSSLRDNVNGNSNGSCKRIIRMDADREKIKNSYRPL